MTLRRSAFPFVVTTALAVMLTGVAFGAGLTTSATKLTSSVITVPTFFPNSAQSSNGGSTAGQAQAADKIIIILGNTQALQSTLCSTWTNSTATRSVAGFTFALNDNASTTATDTVTVTGAPAACASGFHFGTFDLGSAGYVTGGSATFTNSTIALSQATTSTTITLTLGTAAGAGIRPVVATASTATYTPDSTITNTSSVGIGLNLATSTTGLQF